MELARSPFWKTWLDAGFRPRRPGVFRRPFAEVVATPEQVFEWLLAAATNLAANDKRSILRVFSRGVYQPLTPDLFPQPADGTVARYTARLTAMRGETGIVVNNIQAVGGAAWQVGQQLMAGVIGAAGFSAGTTMLDIFAGAYRTGFFGIHKDDQDVLTYVVEGHKRFLVWPYEAFADRPEAQAVVNGARAVISLKHVDARAHLASAIVLEADPGDVIYWPSDHWHLALSDEHTTTVALGFSPGGPAEAWLAEVAAEDDPDARFPAGGDLVSAVRGHLDRAWSEPARRRRLDERVLAHASRLGFFMLPDEAGAEVPATARLAAPGCVAFLRDGDDLVWAAAGTVFREPHTPSLEGLLARLVEGTPFSPDALLAELTEDAGVREALLHVLGVLMRHRCLVAAG
jgi:hypothetical protein